jgi:CRISPR-associated protein Cas1
MSPSLYGPQKAREQLLFPGDRRMPSRIVLIDPDGMVTFDVMEFLSRHAIPLVVLDWRGRVVTSLGGRPSAPDIRLREAQLTAATNGTGLRLSIQLIRDKLLGSITTLRTLSPTPRVDSGIRRVSQVLGELDSTPPADIDSVRILEARAANAYFASWLDVPIRWKGIGKRPIPPEWHRMPLRSSLLGDRNRNTTHPVMAALNYGFGVLESQVCAATLAAGLDPAVGYLHSPRPQRHALVYDLMEPLRPIVERVILDLVRSHTFSPGDVFLTQRGVCRLHPQMVRAVVHGVGTGVQEVDSLSGVPRLLRVAHDGLVAS